MRQRRQYLLKTVPILIILLPLLAVSMIASANNAQTLENISVTLTPGVTTFKQIAPSCYSAIVNMTVTNNSTTIRTISFKSFYIVIVLPNQPVGNTTNTSFFSPNNQLAHIILFPPSPEAIPVVMQISFINICLPSGTNPANDIKLVYYDGNTYKSWIPTINGNTITWN